MKSTLILLDYLNEHAQTDTFSKIIIYIFTYRSLLPRMTITELAEKTYVTPSTITRFCKFFNFATFLELKEAIAVENQTDPTRLFRLNKEELNGISDQPSLSFQSYGNEIIQSIQNTLETVSIQMIDELIKLITEHNQIIIFGYSSSIQMARNLQEGLLLSDKLVFIGNTESRQKELARSLTEDSLALIISSYGNFFVNHSFIFDQILASNCQTALLTQQQDLFIRASIHAIFCINSISYQKIGSYFMNFFIDFLCRKYFDTTKTPYIK